MDTSELLAELIEHKEERGGRMPRSRPTSLERDILGAAACDVSILVTGAGPAQEIAQRIHRLRRGRPGHFRAVDCGWPEATLEQQLFGVLQLGSGGTIFLEEVSRLSSKLQERLFDALSSPSGSQGRTRPRVMASTSEPLLQRALEGTFNEGLFYRLNTVHLILPPDLEDL